MPIVAAVNLSGERLQDVPVTFGEPFRVGDVPRGESLVAYVNGQSLPTQVDAKALNPDGSLRHAVVTVLLPHLSPRASEKLSLRAVPRAATDRAVTIADLLAASFDANVTLTVGGSQWRLDARSLLQQAAKDHSCKPWGETCSSWLSGPLVSEWVVGGPVRDARNTPNPNLSVYFAVRAYGPSPVSQVRVDVIVENDWAYAVNPQNITYDAQVDVGGRTIYSINNLTHFRQARWHKVFWWGKADPVYVKQDSLYLQSTRAVPRYAAIQLSERMLSKVAARMEQRCGPMQRCDQSKDMSTVGAQAGIGPLPRWTSAYVIDPTYETFRWMLANNDALGSYPVHYRDRVAGRAVAVEAHPCATLIGPAETAKCPVAPFGDDQLPKCAEGADCKVPWVANIAHVPSAAYVAYLVTGDWYYLTEMTDWADWELLDQNPAYRGYTAGYIHRLPLRAQAWALRTLGYAAYILPDADPFKHYFNQVVVNNIDWYNQHYTGNPDANKLHIITNGSIVYPNHGKPYTGIAVWQASFFTWSVGNLKDLGFAGAGQLLDWVGTFQVNLMTDPGYCWPLASTYELQVRDTKHSPLFQSLKEAMDATYPEIAGVACNSNAMLTVLNERSHHRYAKSVMRGHPESPTGFPANFQIGLAASADSAVPNARKAWELFENRSVKPDYRVAPQFAVIPRELRQ